MRRVRSEVLVTACVLLAAAGLASCSKDPAEAKNCRKGSGGNVTLVASNVAWDTPCIDVAHGTIDFTIDNKDDVQHNLRVRGNGVNEHTKLRSGPVTQHLSVRVEAGTYTYVCDIHANMEGKLYVS